MAVLEYDSKTYTYKDTKNEYIDAEFEKPATQSSILAKRTFVPICEVLVKNLCIEVFWHHYKVNNHIELIQFIATAPYTRSSSGRMVVGQLTMLATRNILANRGKYPGIDFQYSQNKFDTRYFETVFKNLNMIRYEADINPNGISAVIASLDVLPQFRHKKIASALLYIATHSIKNDIPIFIDNKPYEPNIPLLPIKAKSNASNFTTDKITQMLSNMGFVPANIQVEAPYDITAQAKNRLIYNRNKPISKAEFSIQFMPNMKPYNYSISLEERNKFIKYTNYII